VSGVVSTLRLGIETENTGRIMEVIHTDYMPSRSELRSSQRDVFRRFSVDQIEFHTVDFTRANSEVNLKTEWNLRWREVADDKIKLRRGRTTFRLRREDEKLRIISQRGDELLGIKEPGREEYSE